MSFSDWIDGLIGFLGCGPIPDIDITVAEALGDVGFMSQIKMDIAKDVGDQIHAVVLNDSMDDVLSLFYILPEFLV